MLRSVIRNLIHRPFVYSLDIFISINQERINSELKTKRPALIHMERQGQSRQYNKCLFFDKMDE